MENTTEPSPFDSIIERRDTYATKWHKYAGQDILPFWVADMDFAAPPFILDAVKAEVGERTDKLLAINGSRSVDSLHRELGIVHIASPSFVGKFHPASAQPSHVIVPTR